MTHLPSGSGRLRTALYVFVTAAIVSGCGLIQSGPRTATPMPSTVAFAASSKLAANLASLGEVSGPIHGTMTIGDEQRQLSGTVSIKGKESQIKVVDDKDAIIADEIIVGGHRYTSPDDVIWIDRGREPAGASIAEVLASAGTTLDAGQGTVDEVTGHKILTPTDVVDVAPALGIDTWTFDDESTTLRVWADATGKPLGFGAVMSWKVTLGGTAKTVTSDLDVMFTYTSPVDIAAPDSPWQWLEDKPTGIAIGHPGNNGSTSDSVFYGSFPAGGESLDQGTKNVIDSLGTQAGDTQGTTVGSEPATVTPIRRTQEKDYGLLAIAVHETVAYWVFVVGSPSEAAKLDDQARLILSTVEFTR